MPLIKVLAVCAIAATAVPAPASAEELQPIGSWNLDYGDTACTAARQFGSPSEPLVFAIMPSIDGANYELVINTPKGGPRYAEELTGSVNFGQKSVSTLITIMAIEQRIRASTNTSFLPLIWSRPELQSKSL